MQLLDHFLHRSGKFGAEPAVVKLCQVMCAREGKRNARTESGTAFLDILTSLVCFFMDLLEQAKHP